jgi:superfamily II DNA or RNA helicase
MTTSPSVAPDDLVRIRGERWRVRSRVDFGQTAVVDVDGCDAGNRSVRARFLLPCDRMERLPAGFGPRVVSLRRWRLVARRALAGAVPGIDSLRTAAGAAIRIIPFQLEPALAVIRGLGSRLLIADDVGLGKTIQSALVIAEVLARAVDGRAVVLCPASLRDQWREELQSRFNLDAAVHDAASLARTASTSAGGANPWTVCPVAITSIDFVKRPEVIRALESIVWDVAVLDESHTLAGTSERAHAASLLARRSRVVVMLSATPHSGDDEAFSRLQRLGRLPGDPPLLIFRRTRSDAGLSASRRTRWLRVRSSVAEIDLHRALLAYARQVWRQSAASSGARLAMSVLIKRACSSAASAGRSIDRRLRMLVQPVEATLVQLALPFSLSAGDDAEPTEGLAVPGLDDLTEERQCLMQLLDLAERASKGETKLGALQRLLRRTTESVIVFTEYRDTLERIGSFLPADTTLRLHGGQTPAERQEALRAFTAGEGRILLATDTASEGLNLHHRCRLVINMELPWTPPRLEQRVGRVDRIGQPHRVHAVHLIAGGTPEEDTVARLLRRSAHASAALTLAGRAAETDVLRVVMEDSDAPLPAPSSARDCLAVDVQEKAREESARLAIARSLMPAQNAASEDVRPAITIRRRRLRDAAVTCCWAFRGAVLDSSGQLLWNALVALTATVQRDPPREPRALRVLLDPDRTSLREAVALAHAGALDSVRSGLAPWLALMMRREQDIADELSRTRARLAALQPGLFDHRADRAAHAQSAVLDAACARCADRLEQLSRLRAPVCGAHALLFAVAVA